MKTTSKLLGYISLLVILIMPFAYFFDAVSFSVMTGALLISTLVWYVTAFFWIGKASVPNLDDDPIL